MTATKNKLSENEIDILSGLGKEDLKTIKNMTFGNYIIISEMGGDTGLNGFINYKSDYKSDEYNYLISLKDAQERITRMNTFMDTTHHIF